MNLIVLRVRPRQGCALIFYRGEKAVLSCLHLASFVLGQRPTKHNVVQVRQQLP